MKREGAGEPSPMANKALAEGRKRNAAGFGTVWKIDPMDFVGKGDDHA
jgi:hypothetical protein